MSRRIHTGGSSRGLSGRDGHDAGWLADGGVSDSSASAQWGGYVSSASGSSRPRLRRRGSVDGTSGGGGGGRRRGGGGEAAAVAVDSSSEDMDARYVRARDVSAAAAVNVYGGGGAPLRRRSTSRGRTARRGRGRSRDGPSRGRGCSREDSGGDGGDGSGGGGNSSTSLAAAAAAAAVAAEAATRPLNRLPMGSSSARRRREAAAAVAAADATTAAMGEGNTSGWVLSPLAPVMPDDWTLDSSVSATSGSSRRRRGGLRRELGEPPSASSTTTTAAAGDHGAWVDPAWVTFSRPPRGGRGRRRRRRVADDPTASGGLPYYSRSGGSFGGGGGGWGSRSGRGGMLGALVSRLSLLRRGFGGGGNGGGEGHGHLPSASLARMAVLVLGFFVFYLAWTAGAGERGAPPAAETGRSGSIDGGDLAAVPAMPAKLSFGGAALDFVRRWITTASSVVTGGDESDGGGGGALGGDDVGTPAGPDAATDAVAAGKPASPPADGQLTDLQKAAAVVLTVKEDPDDAEAPLAAQRLRPPSASMPLPPAVSVSPSADLPASTPPSPPPSPPPSASPSTSASPSPSEAPSEAPLETPSVVATATAAGAPSPATKEQGDRAHTGGAGEAAAAPTSTGGGGGGESAPADRVSGEGRDGVGAAAPAVADGPPPSTAGSGQENGPATTRGNDSGGVGDSVASAATPGNGTDGMVSATAPAAAAPSSLMPLNNLLRWDMDAVENPTLGRHVVGLGTKHDHIVVHKPLCVDPATEKLHFLDTGARCSGFNQTAVWLQQYCPMMQESCIKEALLPLGDRMPASWLAEAEAAGNVDWVEAPTVVQFMEKNCGNIAHYAGRALMLEHVVANSVAYIGTTAPRGIENVLLVPSLHVMKRFTLPHNYGYWHKSLLAALVGPARLRLSTLDRFVAHARKPYVGKLRVHLVNNLTRAARVGDPSAGVEGGPARLVCFRTAVTPSFLKARFFVDDSEYPSALPSIPLVPVEGAPAVPRDAVRVRSRVHALLHPKEPGVAVNWGLPTPPPVAKRVVFIDRYGSRRALGASDKERLTGLLSELAASKGFTFEKVTFDNMTFDEQVTTMSTAAMAVGIHGANLVNSAFMPANAVLVELFPYQFTHDMYVEGGHAGVRYFAHHMLTGTDFPGLARYRTAARCIVRSHDCKVHYRDSQLTITDADLTALTATFTSAFKFLHLVAKHRSALKAAGGGGSGGDGRDGGGGGTEASRDGGGGGGAITSGDRPHGPDDLVPATAGDPPEQHGF